MADAVRLRPSLRVVALALLAILLSVILVHAVAPIRPIVDLRRGITAWIDAVDLGVEVRIRFVVGAG